MFETRILKVKIVVEPKQLKSWSNDIGKWLEENIKTISNTTNGHVISIDEYSCGPLIIWGFESKLVSTISVRAQIFMPQIGEKLLADFFENHQTYSLYTLPNSIVWLNGPQTAARLFIIVEKIKYDNGRFLIIGRLVH